MKVELLEWQDRYSTTCTPEAYAKLKARTENLAARALLIYDKYCQTEDRRLYDGVFTETVAELWKETQLLARIDSSHLNRVSLRLSAEAGMVVWEHPLQGTMLYDLAACIRGY